MAKSFLSLLVPQGDDIYLNCIELLSAYLKPLPHYTATTLPQHHISNCSNISQHHCRVADCCLLHLK